MPPDYTRLIGPETWAFIRETEGWYPPETATYPIERQREVYNAMCQAFHRGRPAGIRTEDVGFSGVPCRIYTPEAPAGEATVIYYHGGGFVVGGLDSHDDVCAELAAATGLRVVSADYRLAPEHRHPAAFDDALAVARAVGAEGPILLAGDSAGGSLAAAVAHRLRGDPVPVLGQVLIYPTLGGDRNAGSYLTHADAPMLTLEDVEFYVTIRHPGGVEPEAFLLRLRDAISIDHFVVGIIKAPVMAAVIGIVACVEGLAVQGSAESLGQHTTSSVVKGIFFVIVMDGVFAIFFASIGM